MRTDRVILRSILTTLLSIIVMFGIMLGALCWLFPSAMTKITHDLGMDKASLRYATRTYKRTGDVTYAAFAFDSAISLKELVEIEENGLLFIADDEFLSYCKLLDKEIATNSETVKENQRITMPYEQYVYGQVTMAQYLQGKKADAIATALASIQNRFPRNNAAALLYITASKGGDTEIAVTLKTKMQELRVSELTEEDRAYLEDILSA